MTKSSNRRQNLRILGPFEGTRHGLVDMALQIYDLSIGGCFVKWVHEPPHKGQVLSIRVELPNGEAVVTKAETAFVSAGFGFGVKFCQLSNENRIRLETALEMHFGAVQD